MERFEQLSQIFPGKVALLHGKLSSEEKELAMAQFSKRDGDISVLVSTTVVEVGVDVPDASICVIDRAENFGLSQIHQIRGRVGRGEKPERETLKECFCVLLYQDVSGEDEDPLSPKAKLQILARSNDGFEIAESDLKLRGPGDIFGLRQHGEAGYRVASLGDHWNLLGEALAMATKMTTGENGKKQLPMSLQAVLSMFLSQKEGVQILEEPAQESSHSEMREIVPATNKKDENTYLILNDPGVVVVFLDLETTGLNSKSCSVTQICAKVLPDENNLPSSDASLDFVFNAYVSPSDEVSAENAEFTGLTGAFLKEHGHTFSDTWTSFKAWIKAIKNHGGKNRKVVVAAHNGRSYDFQVLGSEVARYYGANVNWMHDASIDGLFDTLLVLRELQKANRELSSCPKLKLETVYTFVTGAEPGENLHNAIADVLALETVFQSPIIGNWKSVATRQQFPFTQQ